MASFHLSVKTVGRSAGRSGTAAASYRSGEKIVDERTGEIHDYRRRGGVESTDLVLPDDAPEWATDRGKLWNAAEASETRKNSTVAREFEIALPAELSPKQRHELALAFAREIVARHGCAADVAIHAPGGKGDNRNHHAHILCTTRRLKPDGFGVKCRELDDLKTGEVGRWRERFAELQNQHLERAGVAERVDHRSLEAQGIERPPTVHLGPAATGIEQRTGQASEVRKRAQRAQADEKQKAERSADRLERLSRRLDKTIARLAGEIAMAVSRRVEQAAQILKRGMASFGAEDSQERDAKTLGRDATTEQAPKPAQQKDEAQLVKAAQGKIAQWSAAIAAERKLYLAELTEKAKAKVVTHVAQHQAHLDDKPMLFGRDKWEALRQKFADRDQANKRSWNELKDGNYPSLFSDVEDVREAVERRVSDKNPELTRSVVEANKVIKTVANRVAEEKMAKWAIERAEKLAVTRQSSGRDRGPTL